MEPTTDFKKLLEEIENLRDDAIKMKAEALLQEMDALEKRIKNVGPVGMKLKTVQKEYYKEVYLLKKKAYLYATEGLEKIHQKMRFMALSIAVLFFCLYIVTSFSHHVSVYQPAQIIVWVIIGILGGSFVGLNIYLLYTILMRGIERRYNQGRPPSKLYFTFVASYFSLTIINSISVTLQILITWIYPFSSSFIDEAINKINQGDTLLKLYAFITVIITIINFIQIIFLGANFLKKVFRKKKFSY